MKKLMIVLGIMIQLTVIVYAQEGGTTNNFFIIPQAEINEQNIQDDIQEVWSQGWHVIDRYNQIASDPDRELGEELASGIMNRDTLLDYVVYLIRFISQLGILIWAIMIIIAGYKYATAIFTGGEPSWANDNIKNAIIGVVVIASSYAFMKILTAAFL